MSDPLTTPLLSGATTTGARLGLRLTKSEDRRGHALFLELADGTREDFAFSLEGTAADRWPPSPPLQSATIEGRPTSQVALLVGMSGRNHWSASYSIDAQQPRVELELACRVNEAGSWLGSSYCFPDEFEVSGMGDDWMLIVHGITIRIHTSSPALFDEQQQWRIPAPSVVGATSHWLIRWELES